MRYVVTGRVQPERADISFSRIEMAVDGDGTMSATCESSQVTVVLIVPSIDGWITAYVAAGEFVGMIISALGFALGSGYSVELIQVIEEDGTAHVFGVRPTGNSPGETLGFQPHAAVFSRALHLAARDVFFRFAVRDLVRATTDTRDCAAHCYRAIEAIKSAFAVRTGADGWEAMHAALGTNRISITTTVKNYADPVRHGGWINAKPTTGADRWRMLKLTRDILAGYLDVEAPQIHSASPSEQPRTEE